MSKYSAKFKLHVVKEYLKGDLGYNVLSRKYGIPGSAQLERWVRAYQTFGIDGLNKKSKKQVYPVQFKLDVIEFIKRTGASYQETAIKFGIHNPTMITNWYKLFSTKGVEGLKDKPKGRSSMKKISNNQPPKQEKILSRERQLEREIELLRLENAYLKKLNAFQENPNAYLEKHKQRWHSNSKKKDLN